MVRVEVVAPSDRIDDLLRSIGRLGLAHFINLNTVKINKYKTVTEDVERSTREDHLLHLSNRIINVKKKLGCIPHPPEPVALRSEPAELLREIEEQLRSIEVSIAEVENLVKMAAEEKSSLERDRVQFYDELQGVKGFLREYGLDLSSIPAIDRRSLAERDIIKDLHSRLLEVQKALLYVDMVGKLALPYGELPPDEAKLREAYDEINELLSLTEKTRVSLPDAQEHVAKLEVTLRDAKDVVEKKLEAVGKLNSARTSAVTIKEAMKNLREKLSKEIVAILGERFWANAGETERLLDKLAGLTLGSPEVEEAVRGVSRSAQEISRGFEVLLNVDKYLTLQEVDVIINAVREEQPSEVESLLERVRRLLAVAPLEHVRILERALNILRIEQRIKVLTDEHPKLLAKLEEIARKVAPLHAYDEAVGIELKLEELKRRSRRTARTTVFEMWVKESDIEKLANMVREAFPGVVLHVASEEEGDKPPTVLRNPTIARCYERLVEAYGLPNYHELDPSIIMVLSFPIIFGMMFGDIGHGIIVLVGGLLIKPIFDKYKIQGEMWDPLYKGRVLIISCGVMAILFGLLYGDFFGPTFTHNHHYPEGPYWYTMLTGLSEPLWFNPALMDFGGPIVLLKVAIIVGIIQIIFGIVLDLANKLVHREFKECLCPVSWLWFYGGLSYLILTRGLQVGRMIIDEPLSFTLILIAPFVGMILLHGIAEGFSEGFSEAITKAIESLSNTISYGRIMALGIVHALFSEIALLGWGSFMFVPIFFLVTLFMILALEGIITFAHTLRLHWVEWFSKFYRGDGVPFEAFKIEWKFAKVV
ncbi:MAG: V-type ATPase 116kDa subunit family protein [Candidatus Bathyarchaeia archaeon]